MFVSGKCTKPQKLFQWKSLAWYRWLYVIFAPINPENLKWEFILFNHTTTMSQNFGKFANFAPDITQQIWSSKIIFVFFNPEFVGCVVKTLIQNQINICINICDLNIWTLLRYEKIKNYKNIFTKVRSFSEDSCAIFFFFQKCCHFHWNQNKVKVRFWKKWGLRNCVLKMNGLYIHTEI